MEEQSIEHTLQFSLSSIISTKCIKENMISAIILEFKKQKIFIGAYALCESATSRECNFAHQQDIQL